LRSAGPGAVAPQGRPKGKGKLAAHRSFPIELVERDGDITDARTRRSPA